MGTDKDGTRRDLLEGADFLLLLRRIRRIPGAVIVESKHSWWTDEAFARVRYKDAEFTVKTLWSDAFIESASSSEALDEFKAILGTFWTTWWDRWFGDLRPWAWIALVGLLAAVLVALLK